MPRWKNERTRRRQCDVALHGLNLLAAVLLNEQRQREWSTTIMACNSAIQAAYLTYALHLHSAAQHGRQLTVHYYYTCMHVLAQVAVVVSVCVPNPTPGYFAGQKRSRICKRERERKVLQMRCMQRIAMHIHVLLDLLRQKRSLNCCCCIAPCPRSHSKNEEGGTAVCCLVVVRWKH